MHSSTPASRPRRDAAANAAPAPWCLAAQSPGWSFPPRAAPPPPRLGPTPPPARPGVTGWKPSPASRAMASRSFANAHCRRRRPKLSPQELQHPAIGMAAVPQRRSGPQRVGGGLSDSGRIGSRLWFADGRPSPDGFLRYLESERGLASTGQVLLEAGQRACEGLDADRKYNAPAITGRGEKARESAAKCLLLGPHAVGLRVVLEFSQPQHLHQRRHIHAEAAAQALLQAIPAAHRIIR